jgi:hypothetical protein
MIKELDIYILCNICKYLELESIFYLIQTNRQFLFIKNKETIWK